MTATTTATQPAAVAALPLSEDAEWALSGLRNAIGDVEAALRACGRHEAEIARSTAAMRAELAGLEFFLEHGYTPEELALHQEALAGEGAGVAHLLRAADVECCRVCRLQAAQDAPAVPEAVTILPA